ncbi:DoxX family protein [Actinokineospora cianjurensis]|uniref:DoxX-like protein n=1 Tax=Actinokineospora cianjurensis TaxID=585224 RepID=A0A421AYW1_9PSEU|nr:DoxX family protein [Actinokineospora cianjurensis]RLK55053.1 DoxX-like protein [Actinokineospora cianjurensis]
MNVVLWIAASLLAAAFLAAGLLKVAQPKAKLAESGLGWVEDFGAGTVKAIGAIEALGALGLVLPALVDIAPVLVPIAATGLAVAMVGAVAVHVRRREYSSIGVNVVLLAIAVFVAWGRFGPYAF